MGSNVDFFAFKTEPDLEVLRSLEWLKSWRLFKEEDQSVWYLEGQSQYKGITFFEQIKTSKIETPASIDKLSSNILQKIKTDGGSTSFFCKSAFLHTMMLSKALSQPVLQILGNDEELDSAFICNSGELVQLRFRIDWDRALIVTQTHSLETEHLYPPDTDPDLAEPRMIHQIAREQATEFFNSEALWPISSDPFDFQAKKFLLIAKRGRSPKPREGDAMRKKLNAKLGENPSLKLTVKTMETIIQSSLDQRLVLSERAERDLIAEQIGQCLRFVSGLALPLHKPPRHEFFILNNLLSDISAYFMILRPKPEFRKRVYNFRDINRRLKWRWFVLRLKTYFL